ncbi:hypothetical protein F5984_05810 [Rudanella paleaurantiibacter]|uniref:Protein kinase domain-containing protein n=1 Tax=Rudanella paleaurantiibacter TaxID=2614655 RepID=A0A7J5U210_9BACT|nr:hypothetical protein [Rudanella paleaurantiibacter]KAB7731740.1 hypothetical protein F5984_05810 [Rudanella paleaurantiibacter]
MAFPRGDEYNQAVQNPNISFTDVALQRSQVETQLFGLPKPYSGGFTVTYKLQSPNGNWAVRCFTRQVRDLEKRYKALSALVQSNPSLAPYFVEANYLPSGIRINGQLHGIIKMRWVEGDPLNLYIGKIYQQSHVVEGILTTFVGLVQKMEAAGIAHGDLQHGNIIISEGKMLLIDYDDIYLPGIPGLKANSEGQPNYQHPKRTQQNYGKTIDRFSAIVIYLGLKAVKLKPALWAKYDNGENILIKNTDIANLSVSPLMQELSAITELKPLVDRFKGICYLSFDQVPTLNEFLEGAFTYSTTNTGTITVRSSQYAVLDGRKKGSILEHFGERVEVIGRIDALRESKTRYGAPYVFLNFGVYPNQTFTVVIWSDGLEQLSAKGLSINSFKGKWVSVTGVVGSYKEVPQIAVETISQIQILDNEKVATDKLNPKSIPQPAPQPVPQPRPVTPVSSVPKNPPAPKVPTPKQGEEVFNTLYGNRPVTPAPTLQPSPRHPPQSQPISPKQTRQPVKPTAPTVTSTPPNSSTNKQPSPPKKGFWRILADFFS